MTNASTGARVPNGVLLDAARRGDDDAFRRLVEPHRAELHSHCYRMLGSTHDAEDALQDAMLRAWRGLAGIEDGRALRPWLYKIATNTSLDAIRRRPKRVLPIDCDPSPTTHVEDEPIETSRSVGPYPDAWLGDPDRDTSPEARYEQREALELAFIAALQHLPGRQRAVLILREVLRYSAREVADMLDATVASVNSALQRARKTIDERLPEQSQQATLRSLGDERVRDLVERFVDAFETGNVEAILAMLAEDATFAMPPHAATYRGREAIAQSWLMPDDPPGGLRYLPTRANGQLAFGVYRFDSEQERYLPIALDVLTLRDVHITDVTAFRMPAAFGDFGLPVALSASGEPE